MSDEQQANIIQLQRDLAEVKFLHENQCNNALTFMRERDEALSQLAAAEECKAELASKVHEVDAARTERIVELEAQLAAAEAALKPFAEVARGIPDNWPGQCRLRIDSEDDNQNKPREWLCYHGIVEGEGGALPTIDEWRAAARAAGGAA